jgi:hypothetical protein
MRLNQTSARGGLGLLAALAAVAAFAATAQATVTSTAVTSLPNPFHAPFYDSNLGAGVGTFDVAGTSNGTTGDYLDVICVYGWGGSRTMATNVPVKADGTWDAGQLDSYRVYDDNCAVHAIVHGTSLPSDLSPFTGPMGTFPYYRRYFDTGSSVRRQNDYFTDLWGSLGHSEMGSSGSGGLRYQSPVAPDGNYNDTGWNRAAALYNTDTQSSSRSELNVDGQNAYNAYGARWLWSANPNYSYNNPGRSTMVTSFALDPVTGNYTTTEDEDLVTCPGPASGNYPANSSNCSQFISSGVHFTRKVVQDHDGRLVTIIDSYTSIDGSAHTLTARYDNRVWNSNPEFAMPGQTGLNIYNQGDVVSGPFPAPASIQGATDYGYPASYDYPRGYLTWDTAPDQVRFYGHYAFILDYLNRTIPAGGSLTLRFAYDSSASQSVSDALRAAAVAAFTPPAPPPAITPTPPAIAPAPPAVVARHCVVPPVPRGDRLADAEQRIRLAGCSVGKIKHVFSATRKGRVVSIAPGTGSTKPAGAAVTIDVSKGRRPHARRKH